MIELKVVCDCGQKYKFDVEPVNGQMPFTVACPICKRDGTAKANELLQQLAAFKPVATPLVAAPVPGLIAPPPASAPGRLRMNAPASTEAPADPVETPALSAPVSALRAAGGIFRAAAAAPAQQTSKPPSFALGLLGALIGSLIGAVIYFTIYNITGPIVLLRYVLALGVGGLAGWLANLLGRGEGSKELGGLAAVFTVIGILAAQYFLTLEKWNANADLSDVKQTIEDGGYAESARQAKEVVKAIPTGSDAEIRMYLAKQQTEEGQSTKLETISSDQVKEFRNAELTNCFDLASGKLTKEAYWAKNGFDPKEAQKVLDSGEKAVSGLALIVAVFKAGIISMIAGAGLAFKLSANA
jgi:hypothetical protein